MLRFAPTTEDPTDLIAPTEEESEPAESEPAILSEDAEFAETPLEDITSRDGLADHPETAGTAEWAEAGTE